MPLITVGVPVYNGAAEIGECLECLVNQTYRDIEIVVADNASTDDTVAIVQRAAAKDARIRLIQRPENIGALPNFIALLTQAKTPFFLWRAHDDLSSLDYIERLHAAIVAKPGAKLAAGTVISRQITKTGDTKTITYRCANRDFSASLQDIGRLMFQSHASWFYGLWHTLTLQTTFTRVWALYPNAWASDHLMLYPMIVEGALATQPQAIFIQRIIDKTVPGSPNNRPSSGQLWSQRLRFWQICNMFVDDRHFGPVKSASLILLNWFYSGKRVYKSHKLLKKRAREIFLRPTRTT